MNYANQDITNRAEFSPLWGALKQEQGDVLPRLLERYLAVEIWKYDEPWNGQSVDELKRDMQYVHALLAEAVTVLLSQEERIRRLEKL